MDSFIKDEEALYFECHKYKVVELLCIFNNMIKQAKQIDFCLLTEALIYSIKFENIKIDACEMALSFIVRSDFSDVYYLPRLVEVIIVKINNNLCTLLLCSNSVNPKEERQIKRILTLLIELFDVRIEKKILRELFNNLTELFKDKPFYQVFLKVMEIKMEVPYYDASQNVTYNKNREDEGKDINDKESLFTFAAEKKQQVQYVFNQQTVPSKQLQLWKTKFKPYDTSREAFFKAYIINYTEFQKIMDKSSIVEKEIYLPLGTILLKFMDKDLELSKYFKLNYEADLLDFLKMVNSDSKLQLSWIGSSKNGFNYKTNNNQIFDVVSGMNSISDILTALDGGDFIISKRVKNEKYLDIEIQFKKKVFHLNIHLNIKGSREQFLKSDEIFSKVFEHKAIKSALIAFNELLQEKSCDRIYNASVLMIRYLQLDFDIFDSSYKHGLNDSQAQFYYYQLKRDFYQIIITKCGSANERYIAGYLMIELVRFLGNMLKFNDINNSDKEELKPFIEVTKKILNEDSKYMFSIQLIIQSITNNVQAIELYHLMSLLTENASKVDSLSEFKNWK